MGKEGDLWDDSALIKAFDNAISKYKLMHGVGGSMAGEKAVSNAEENLPAAEADNESNESPLYTEHVQNDDNLKAAPETTAKIGETDYHSQIKENSPLELGSSAKCVGSSNIQNGNLPPTNENPAVKSGSPGAHMISSDIQSQSEATWYSNGSEEYSQLLNRYYELEDERQKVLQQLNQYSNWNYQQPISSTSTSEEYQTIVPQSYDTVTCYCPYGCQNWVVPCNSLPASQPVHGGTNDICCNATSKGSQNGNSMPQEDPDIVKTAMVAAERALSSLKKDASANADIFSNRGRVKELGVDIGQFAESTKSATDLDVVLNAWYSAGFYTGKYLSEQSLEKRKCG